MAKNETFISLFNKTRLDHLDDECYISYDGDLNRRSISFNELWSLASRFAHFLKQQGLKRGDYVVVTTPLSIEYMVAGFGIIMAGGIHVSMEKFFPNCEMLIQTVKMTQAKFMLMSNSPETDTWSFFKQKSEFTDSSERVTSYLNDAMPSLTTIIMTNKREDKQDYKGFLNQLAMCKDEYRDNDLDSEDSCVCVSSLNPGVATPKLVEMSHRAVVNVAKLYHKRFSGVLNKIHFRWPWYIGATLPYDALTGGPQVITDSFSKMTQGYSQHNLKVIEIEGLQSTIMGPPDIKGLADVTTDRDHKLLKHILSGGQPMTKAIFEVAQQVSSNVHIVYFVSECNFVTCNDIGPTDTFTPFDSGHALEGVEVRIIGENDEELPRGETGRIVVRSPYLFTRYPGQPELTKSVMREGGWFYSNDAGCFSSDGHLHVYGRRGDVISRGITLTYPSWIEKPIWNIKDVIEVMAVPVPDDINYQNVCACVVLRPASSLTDKDVMRLYTESMSEEGNDFFHLDHVVIFDEALPKLARDKLGDVAAKKLGLKKNGN